MTAVISQPNERQGHGLVLFHPVFLEQFQRRIEAGQGRVVIFVIEQDNALIILSQSPFPGIPAIVFNCWRDSRSVF